uniref:A disintegrin and metalloprotease n=1 Tax=Pneumocystis carinii TaxID=4754 RepID=A3QZA9_PNECA|nr:a disintegrin and metalloprotease [Pneumocystis carinii]
MQYLFKYMTLFPLLKGIHASLITQQTNIHEIFTLEDVVLYPHEISKKSIDSYSSFDLTFALPYHYQQTEYPNWMKKYVKLTMTPNLDLINENSHLQIHNEDGEVISSEKIDRNNHRVYRGDAFVTYTENSIGLLEKRWHKIGWARISLHQDGDLPIFEGTFSLSNDLYTVKTAKNYMLLKEAHEPQISASEKSMVLWIESNKPPKTLRKRSNLYLDNKCMLNSIYDEPTPLDQATFSYGSGEISAGEKLALSSSRIRLTNYIGDNSGCPKYKQVAYVGAALDCNYISMFESSSNATNHIISLYNRVSAIYEETFNISLGLLNVTIMGRTCPNENPKVSWNVACSSHYNISTRLKHFSLWRSGIKDSIALWSLFTTCRNTMEVGIAWYGVLCQDIIPKGPHSNWVSGTNVIASPANIEHIVLAHEIGHGFGASHDCTSESCKNESASCCPLSSTVCDTNEMYIMNPKSSISARKFSPCSIGQVCNNLKKKLVNSNCLKNNKNVSLISRRKCGNGIVEEGEDCDCGGEKGCKGNPCCNPKTCKFTKGSVCE